MANVPKVSRDAGFERPAKVKRLTGRGRISKFKTNSGRSPYDNPPSRAKAPSRRYG